MRLSCSVCRENRYILNFPIARIFRDFLQLSCSLVLVLQDIIAQKKEREKGLWFWYIFPSSHIRFNLVCAAVEEDEGRKLFSDVVTMGKFPSADVIHSDERRHRKGINSLSFHFSHPPPLALVLWFVTMLIPFRHPTFIEGQIKRHWADYEGNLKFICCSKKLRKDDRVCRISQLLRTAEQFLSRTTKAAISNPHKTRAKFPTHTHNSSPAEKSFLVSSGERAMSRRDRNVMGNVCQMGDETWQRPWIPE